MNALKMIFLLSINADAERWNCHQSFVLHCVLGPKCAHKFGSNGKRMIFSSLFVWFACYNYALKWSIDGFADGVCSHIDTVGHHLRWTLNESASRFGYWFGNTDSCIGEAIDGIQNGTIWCCFCFSCLFKFALRQRCWMYECNSGKQYEENWHDRFHFECVENVFVLIF